MLIGGDGLGHTYLPPRKFAKNCFQCSAVHGNTHGHVFKNSVYHPLPVLFGLELGEHQRFPGNVTM